MPAVLTQARAALARLRAITGGATGFASETINTLDQLAGENNEFGTAATRDTGNADGQIPLLGADGKLPDAVIPDATTTQAGAVVRATSLNDTRPNAVPTVDQVSIVSSAFTGLSVGDLDFTELQSGVDFTTPAAGIFLIRSGGGGGHTPPLLATENYIIPTGAGMNVGGSAGLCELRYGSDLTSDSSATRIVVAGGVGGGLNPSSDAQAGIRVHTDLTQTETKVPEFAVTFFGKGGQGGDPGLFDPGANPGRTPGLPGRPGDLLIAKVGANQSYRVILGARGTGRASLGTNSIAARDGQDATAVFIQLAEAPSS